MVKSHSLHIKHLLLVGLASVVLVIGLAAGSASAQEAPPSFSSDCNGVGNCDSEDNSINLEECAVYSVTDQENDQEVDTDSDRILSGDEVKQNAGNAVDISTDCSSVTNVTNVTEAAEEEQVDAPVGAVNAGAGAVAGVSLTSALGLLGSLSTAGFGLALRRE